MNDKAAASDTVSWGSDCKRQIKLRHESGCNRSASLTSLRVLHPTVPSPVDTVLLQGGQRGAGPVQALMSPQQAGHQRRAAATGQQAAQVAEQPQTDAPVLMSARASRVLRQPAPPAAPPLPGQHEQLSSVQIPRQPGPGHRCRLPSIDFVPLGPGPAQGLQGGSQAHPGQAQMPGPMPSPLGTLSWLAMAGQAMTALLGSSSSQHRAPSRCRLATALRNGLPSRGSARAPSQLPCTWQG